MISLLVEPRASLDIEETAMRYENQLTGLGTAFVLETDFAIERIQKSPKLYPCIYGTVRRILLRRFPFAMYFLVKNSEICVLAVLHQVRSDKTVGFRLS